MRKIVHIGALYLTTLMLVACANIPFVYQMEIHQGTILDREQVERLEIGMSKRQVEFLLGSPPLVDPFVEDRWEYVHMIKEGNRRLAEERLTVFFENDRVSRIKHDQG